MPLRIASQPTAANSRVRTRNDGQSQATNVAKKNERDANTTEFSSRHRVQRRPSMPSRLSGGQQCSGSSLNEDSVSFLPPKHLYNDTTGTNGANDVDDRRRPTNRLRQSSTQTQRAPMGPRPQEAESKKFLSNTLMSSDPPPSSSTSRDAHGRHEFINNISRFSFASMAPESKTLLHEESTAPSDLEDGVSLTVNFDDFHSNITATEISPTHFLAPNTATTNLPRPDDKSTIPRPVSTSGSVRKSSAGGGCTKRQQSAVSSVVRRQASNSESMLTSEAGSSSSRRQSHFPPNSFHNGNLDPRVPRKSICHGNLSNSSSSEPQTARRRPNLGARKSVVGSHFASLASNEDGGPNKGIDLTGLPASRSNSKSKSIHPPGRTVSPESSMSPQSPAYSPSSPTNLSQTPGIPLTRTATPSSANKRLSIMPHHATGLGARTVSPTDARRLKRLSMMPHAPPLPVPATPHPPATPRPEMPPTRPRSMPQSPAPNGGKSVTPTSSRTTPDPNRKSYSSGQSLSSSTSYSSNKNAPGPTLRQLQGPASSSRWPTPKPRLDTNVNETEEVPPVPAIPKAFESPFSETDQPFFSAQSSTLPHVDNPIYGSPAVHSFADAISATGVPKNPSSPGRKSSLISDGELRPNLIDKKAPRPVRLPPINLLPLSPPTAAKIMALDNVEAPEDEASSPLFQDKHVKLPSTPMTASRVNFPPKAHLDSHVSSTMRIRSNSSNHSPRGDFDAFATSLGTRKNIPFSFGTSDNGPRNISPFISCSLPKSREDFVSYMQSDYFDNPSRPTTDGKPFGPGAPISSHECKAEERSANDDTGSSFSTSTIRRKLSLSRRRSSSKNREDPEVVAAAKYKSMPPPRLPASATLNHLSKSSPSQKQLLVKSRRKSSSSSFSIEVVEGDQNAVCAPMLPLGSHPSIDSNSSIKFPRNPSSSSVSLMPKGLSSTSVHPRPRVTNLDRDDVVAENEMEKLALKRKGVEAAARDLDNLRQRARPREPVSPSRALLTGNLNIFEQGEVIDYELVYFTGTSGAKKILGDLGTSSGNFGYDDERGDYNIVHGDHLAFRYEVVDLLGKGSFGQVVRCIDHKTGILVAVKIIRNKKRFHQQALVEVGILQKLRHWDPENEHSVVSFDQSFYFRGHLCISTDLLDMNLYEFIKAHEFRGFSLKLIRRFTKQLLSSLVLLNGHKVIHCDLKPENVLLAHPVHSEIKVIDFGSSCFEREKVYTYIQSRFYRSPEVILGMSYGMPIDMWSLGCILAELYTGSPIFPGENEQEQLACIMEVFGPPEKHLIEKSSRKKLFFDSLGKPRLTVSSRGRRRRPSSKELRQVLKCDDDAFIDFITKCLRWDPSRRLNPHQAMVHEFVTGAKIHSRKATFGPTNSAVKRGNPTSAASARPLPQLPSAASKNAAAAWHNIATPSTAGKPAAKRNYTINSAQPPNSTKQSPHIATTGTGSTARKEAYSQRGVSGRPDLATAAAAAASLRL